MNLALLRKTSLFLSAVLLSGLIGYRVGTGQISFEWNKNSIPKVAILDRAIPKDKPAEFSLFWQVWDEVSNKFVDKSKIDQQKMVYGAISGMVSSLGDPYTVFLPPTQNSEIKSDLNGKFEGIGAQLGMKDNRIVVIAPLKNSPAEGAGIKTGDWIIKVDNAETAKWSLPEAVAKIRGDKGTTVTLNILHDKATKPVDVPIVRDTIKVDSIEWKVVEATSSGLLGKKVAYLRLSRFGDETDRDWDKAVIEIKNKMASDTSVSGMVLDLRNNPGGYLNSAVYLGSEFLPDGIIVKQKSYTGEVQTYSVNRQGKLLDVPLVVLLNQGSASASEILGGALQVRGRAKVVGMQSFGKGSVQEASDISGGSGLHVTIAKWLLPNDEWVNGKGLTPDIKIELDENDPTKDTQLLKAIEVVLSGKSQVATQ